MIIESRYKIYNYIKGISQTQKHFEEAWKYFTGLISMNMKSYNSEFQFPKESIGKILKHINMNAFAGYVKTMSPKQISLINCNICYIKSLIEFKINNASWTFKLKDGEKENIISTFKSGLYEAATQNLANEIANFYNNTESLIPKTNIVYGLDNLMQKLTDARNQRKSHKSLITSPSIFRSLERKINLEINTFGNIVTGEEWKTYIFEKYNVKSIFFDPMLQNEMSILQK